MTASVSGSRDLWFRICIPAAAVTALAVQMGQKADSTRWSPWAFAAVPVLFLGCAVIVVRRLQPAWSLRHLAAFAGLLACIGVLTLVFEMVNGVPTEFPRPGVMEWAGQPHSVNVFRWGLNRLWELCLPLALATLCVAFGLERRVTPAMAVYLPTVAAHFSGWLKQDPLISALVPGAVFLAFALTFLPRPTPDTAAAPRSRAGPSLADVAIDAALVAVACLLVVLRVFPWWPELEEPFGVRSWMMLGLGLLWPLFLGAIAIAPAFHARRREDSGRWTASVIPIAAGMALPIAGGLAAGAALTRPWLSAPQKLAASEPESVRALGASMLGWEEGPEVVSLLTSALADPSARVRSAALEGLERHGLQARPSLQAMAIALNDPDRRVACAAAAAVRSTGADEAPYLLAAALGRPQLKACLEPTLADLGAASVPALLQALKHAQPHGRAAACRVLRWIGPAAAAAGPALSALRDDPREENDVRVEASEALRRIGDYSGSR